MVAGEVRGTPAVDRRADVLGRRDEHGAEDEERDRVAVM